MYKVRGVTIPHKLCDFFDVECFVKQYMLAHVGWDRVLHFFVHNFSLS